jgi:hypothetical protein
VGNENFEKYPNFLKFLGSRNLFYGCKTLIIIKKSKFCKYFTIFLRIFRYLDKIFWFKKKLSFVKISLLEKNKKNSFFLNQKILSKYLKIRKKIVKYLQNLLF